MNLSHGDTRLILSVCERRRLPLRHAAYALAVARHETGGRMKPVRETFADTDAQAIGRLELAWQSGRLAWITAPYWRDGWFGRGYVQLTHEDNYRRAGRALGVDLVSRPDRALESGVAAEVLVLGMQDGWFTGRRLADYGGTGEFDYVAARAIINRDGARVTEGGGTIGGLIASYAIGYERMLVGDHYDKRLAAARGGEGWLVRLMRRLGWRR